jgi:hypothetical protein
MNLLTDQELTQFHVIVETARRERWVGAPSTLAAHQAGEGSSITVTAIEGSKVVEKTYPRDERWPFQLVRDLAWGAFRV